MPKAKSKKKKKVVEKKATPIRKFRDNLSGGAVSHALLIGLVVLSAGLLYWKINSDSRDVVNDIELIKTEIEVDKAIEDSEKGLDLSDSMMISPDPTPAVTTEPCLSDVLSRGFQVTYPCDWTQKNMSSDWLKLESPDGDASFQWPVPDFGLHGFTQMPLSSVEILGADRDLKIYTNPSAANTFEIADMPRKDAMGYSGYIINYTDDDYRDTLLEIMKSTTLVK